MDSYPDTCTVERQPKKARLQGGGDTGHSAGRMLVALTARTRTAGAGACMCVWGRGRGEVGVTFLLLRTKPVDPRRFLYGRSPLR